jgi:uncharacterized membrane protein YqgA involved in biofilm formation
LVVVGVTTVIVLLFRGVGGFVVSAPVLVVVKIELVRRVDELREMVLAATVHLLAHDSN